MGIDDHIKGLFALFHCNNILSVRGWLAVSCVLFRAAFPTAAYLYFTMFSYICKAKGRCISATALSF